MRRRDGGKLGAASAESCRWRRITRTFANIADTGGTLLANLTTTMKPIPNRCNTRAVASTGLMALMLGLSSLAPGPALAGQPSRSAPLQSRLSERSSRDAPGQLEVSAEPVDPRLRFPACDEPLSGTVPALARETARITTEVRCGGSRGWRLFVPVRVSVRKSVVVAAVPLERGKVLAAGDVILAERDVGALSSGYVTGIDGVVGRTLRRPVSAGSALTPALLDAPILVRRGQPVTLEARTGDHHRPDGGRGPGRRRIRSNHPGGEHIFEESSPRGCP